MRTNFVDWTDDGIVSLVPRDAGADSPWQTVVWPDGGGDPRFSPLLPPGTLAAAHRAAD